MMSKTTPPWKRKKMTADSLTDLRFDKSLYPDTSLYVYKVQRGEVIGNIADKFMMKADSIKLLNELATDKLKEGQSLLVRVRAIHKVSKGEFLEKIARHYQADLKAIMKANGIKKADALRTDQKLVIPIPR
jgi:N-acetylmuramoyl-L-alanine amidase